MLPVPPTSTRYKAPVILEKNIGTWTVPLGVIESGVLHLCDFGRVEHLAVLLKDVAGLDVLALESNHQPIKFKPAELARPASQHKDKRIPRSSQLLQLLWGSFSTLV
jgi:hypothetical protein